MADLAPLQTLQRIIAQELPAARAKLDSPHTDTGSWFLDVEWNGAIAVIEWRPSQGFGVAGEDAAFGEGPELVNADPAAAAFAAIARLREAEGARDTLIVAPEDEFRDELRRVLLDAGVFSDAVSDLEDARTQLGLHVYRSVVVQLVPAWISEMDEALETTLDDANLLTIAVSPSTMDWPLDATPAWAEIFVRKSAPPRELALMIHSLLQYRDEARRWPKMTDVPHDRVN
jgi:hypothetical protein